jgi:DNA-binding transcriptional LysR family regulator
MNWDHLRYFLELARAGKLVGAARRMGVDHTTVARRIQALEKQLGAPLFAPEGAGYVLNEAGRALLPQVEQMEAAWLAIEQSAPETGSPRDGTLTGLVRIGSTEGFGVGILAPHLGGFVERHPGLGIDLLPLPRLVHLSRREADIVVALERPARGSVVATRLTDYTLRLYASAAYLAQQEKPIVAPEDLRGHAFVSYVDDLVFSKELRYLTELHRPERFSLRSTSVLAQVQATVAGAGLAVLPAFLADVHPELRQVLPGRASVQRTFWMSIPGELRHLGRMQAVWELLREVVRVEKLRLLPST